MLETLEGVRTVGSATELLGICPAAFYKLRNRTLQEAVWGLEPRPVGRRGKERSESDDQIAGLEEENAALRRQVKILQVREEMAVALPNVGRKRSPRKRGL